MEVSTSRNDVGKGIKRPREAASPDSTMEHDVKRRRHQGECHSSLNKKVENQIEIGLAQVPAIDMLELDGARERENRLSAICTRLQTDCHEITLDEVRAKKKMANLKRLIDSKESELAEKKKEQAILFEQDKQLSVVVKDSQQRRDSFYRNVDVVLAGEKKAKSRADRIEKKIRRLEEAALPAGDGNQRLAEKIELEKSKLNAIRSDIGMNEKDVKKVTLEYLQAEAVFSQNRYASNVIGQKLAKVRASSASTQATVDQHKLEYEENRVLLISLNKKLRKRQLELLEIEYQLVYAGYCRKKMEIAIQTARLNENV